MINLLDIIYNSIDTTLTATIHLFPIDGQYDKWQGALVLSGKGLAESLDAKIKCCTKSKWRKQMTNRYEASKIAPDSSLTLTVILPEKAIKITVYRIYILEKIIVVQTAKYGDDSAICSKNSVNVLSEIRKSPQRSPWKEKEPSFDNLLEYTNSGLRAYLKGQPPNTIHSLLTQRVRAKAIQVLSELAERSAKQKDFVWNKDGFKRELKYDSNSLVNEIIHRVMAELTEQEGSPVL